MRQRQNLVRAALFAAVVVIAGAGGARAQSCDENNPKSPARTTQVLLGASDFTDEAHDALRSFILTGSLGPVTARVVAASPPGIVQSMNATAEISRLSPNYGEQLKGIDIRVTLKRHDRAASISVSLRQVCAQYFRNTFLY
ncbi:MAG TPA: hypothetical protein VGG57_02790 [Stellaceae bacterium]